MNGRNDYIDQTRSFCNAIQVSSIDIISTPISAALIILYIVLYKRRVFLRYKFKYRNIGLPMIFSCWSKNDRLLSSFTYGLIAFNIFNLFRLAITGNGNNASLLPFKDPSGILAILIKVAEVIMIGLRYYPILVGKQYFAAYLELYKISYITSASSFATSIPNERANATQQRV